MLKIKGNVLGQRAGGIKFGKLEAALNCSQ